MKKFKITESAQLCSKQSTRSSDRSVNVCTIGEGQSDTIGKKYTV